MADCTAHDFSATTGPGIGGETRSYRVEGTVRCPAPGWHVTLTRHREGMLAGADVAVLRLVADGDAADPGQDTAEVTVDSTWRDSVDLRSVVVELGDGVVGDDGGDRIELTPRPSED
jgi:hypothetical protein